MRIAHFVLGAAVMVFAVACSDSDDNAAGSGGGSPIPASQYGQPIQQSITVNFNGAAQQRQYWVMVTPDFNPGVPASLVFTWHGLGQDPQQAMSWLGVVGAATNAVLVYPHPTDPSYGFMPYEDEEDFALFDALYTRMMATYNIDANRVFSVAHSNGCAINANLGCDRSDQVRAIANVAHFWETPPGVPDGCDPKAGWMFLYGLTDTVATQLQYPEPAINNMRFLTGCSEQTVPAGPWGDITCNDYTPCEPRAALRWCTHPGGHDWPGTQANQAIWAFFDGIQ